MKCIHLLLLASIFSCLPRQTQSGQMTGRGNGNSGQNSLFKGEPGQVPTEVPESGGGGKPVSSPMPTEVIAAETPVNGGGKPVALTPTPTLTAAPTPVHETACELGNTVRAGTDVGAASCPVGTIAFAADDSTVTRFACCNLPNLDILADERFPAPAGTTCPDDSVAIGVTAVGSTRVLCQRLNTSLYILGPMKASCYYGHGAAGSTGSAHCRAPASFVAALTTKLSFGTDGCLAGDTYIIVGRTGKSCGGILTRQLKRKADGGAVKIMKDTL